MAPKLPCRPRHSDARSSSSRATRTSRAWLASQMAAIWSARSSMPSLEPVELDEQHGPGVPRIAAGERVLDGGDGPFWSISSSVAGTSPAATMADTTLPASSREAKTAEHGLDASRASAGCEGWRR